MPDRSPQFAELQGLLRQAGIVDGASQRLLEELQDHYCDLLSEADKAGLDSRRARERALQSLGSPQDIAAAAAQYRELLSFSGRHPLLAEFSRGLVLAAGVPALPLRYCAQRRESIVRWGASVGLAVMLTAGLLLSMQSALGTL